MDGSNAVLVLDDNIDVAQGVTDILELCGYDVTMVHDGPSAVSAYRNAKFSLGLFDVRMPGMNGVEAFMEIRKYVPDASVLLMSGYADDTLVEAALSSGALGILSKPFEPDDMLERVREACGH